ncbi:MAG: EAL domain-containing protein [Saccharofermentans sp.]|nr:EAL domain-containing protein [Saccharofermentans sp.]
MANKDLKIANRLIRRNPTFSIITMVLLSIILIVSIIASFAVFTEYLVQTKIADKVSAIQEIYKIDNGSSDLLDKTGADYFATDSKGNIILGNEDNTCNMDDEPFELHFLFIESKSDYLIYMDEESGYVFSDGVAGNNVNAMHVINEDALKEEGYVKIPFWAAFAKDGGGELFIKSSIEITWADLSSVIVITALFGIVVILLLVFVLIYGINNIANQIRIRKILFMDRLSGGHNWTWFLVHSHNILKKRINLKSRFAVVDLVFVKYSNFVLCHSKEEGEKMLSKIYLTIATNVGRGNIAAHNAQAHFPMLIKFKDENELRMKLQGIIGKLEKIDQDHKFGFQAGVDVIPPLSRKERKNLDMDVIYNNASAARMQLEDKDISGIRFYDTKLLEDSKWIDRVTEKQQEALAKEEFAVYYQPKYDPNTNELQGAEALIRWISEDLGFVAPGRFIPIFESNGFITEIDHYMLSHVARDQAKWISQGYSIVPVSVNVSRAHFIEDDLAEQIRDICMENGCPAEYIEIELTESAFFDNKDKMVSTIKKLQSYGFAVSMDDFGSGYSSLNSLKDLPLNILKLDAGFFKEGEDLTRSEVVVSEAIRLAKNLNMKTVAEGIEEKPQVDFLAKEGCDMIQGYYFAKPMPGSDYEQKMNKTNPSSAEASDTPGHSE